MPYKRTTHNSKKYITPFYNPTPPYSMNNAGSFQKKDFFGIPLPNEKEIPLENIEGKRSLLSLEGISRFIRKYVKIEEIILIGLIILMLDESIGDELLLIALIYILLF